MNQELNLHEIMRLLQNLIRIGTIHSVEGTRARLQSGDLLTAPAPWLCPRMGNVKIWSTPSPGEQCLLLSPQGNTANGFILPGVLSNQMPAPAGAGANDLVIEIPADGKFLLVCGSSSIEVTADLIDLRATMIDLNKDK